MPTVLLLAPLLQPHVPLALHFHRAATRTHGITLPLQPTLSASGASGARVPLLPPLFRTRVRR